MLISSTWLIVLQYVYSSSRRARIRVSSYTFSSKHQLNVYIQASLPTIQLRYNCFLGFSQGLAYWKGCSDSLRSTFCCWIVSFSITTASLKTRVTRSLLKQPKTGLLTFKAMRENRRSRKSGSLLIWLRAVCSSLRPPISRLNCLTELSCTVTHLALAWVIKRNPRTSTVILGASKPEQVLDNLKALDVIPKLTPEILAKVDAILDNARAPLVSPS